MDRLHPWQPFIMYAPIYLYSNIVDNHRFNLRFKVVSVGGAIQPRDFFKHSVQDIRDNDRYV